MMERQQLLCLRYSRWRFSPPQTSGFTQVEGSADTDRQAFSSKMREKRVTILDLYRGRTKTRT